MKLLKRDVVGLVSLFVLGGSAMAGAQAIPTAGNTYEIIDSSNGQCVTYLTTGGGFAEEGPCANTAATQQWQVTTTAGKGVEPGYFGINEPTSGGGSNNVWDASTLANAATIDVKYISAAVANASFSFVAKTSPYYEIVLDATISGDTNGACVTGPSATYLVIAACSAASNQLWKFVPVFTLTPSSPSLSVVQSSTATDVITVADTAGFGGSVTFAASGLPTGVTAAFSPASSTTSSTVTFTASTTLSGPTAVTITGTSTATTPGSTETTTILLNVVPPEYVFVSNSGGTVSSLTRTGGVAKGATAGGGIGEAIDAAGDVWSILNSGASLSEFSNVGVLAHTYTGTASGISGATALAIDGNGIVWVANPGSISSVTNAGVAVSATPVAQAGGISTPNAITVDSSGSLWLADTGNGTVTEVIGAAAPVTAPVVEQVINSVPGSKP